jgi:L-lactate dehydrogenase (cytochrome)
MSGPNAAMRRYLQAVTHPHWALDVGLMGRPHTLGNISTYKGQNVSLEDYMGYLGANFDPRSRGRTWSGSATSGRVPC